MQILTIIGSCLFAAAILQPLHILPWVSWHSEIMVFASALVFALQFTLNEYQNGRVPTLKIPLLAFSLAALALLIIVQWGAGLLHFGGDAFAYTAFLLLAVLCITFGFSSSTSSPFSPTSLAKILTLCAVCSALLAFMQVSGYADNLSWIQTLVFQRPGANIAQPNHLATLLLMGACSVVFLYEKQGLSATTTVILLVLLITAAAATQSRAGMISILVLATWWTAKRNAVSAKSSGIASSLIFSLFFLAFFYWPTLMANINITTTTQTFSNPGGYNRLIVWPQLIQAVFDRPLFGWGFGQVSKAHNSVVDDFPQSEAYSYAHNIVLDLALGLGLPITLAFLLISAIWTYRKICNTKDMTNWYCLALLVPVCVHSLFEFPYAYAYFLAPVMLAIGNLERLQSSKAVLIWRGKWLIIGVLVASIMLAWSVIEYIEIEEDFRVVRLESLRYGKTPETYQRPRVILFSQLDALLHAGRIVPKPNMSAEEIELARVVAMRFPWIAVQNRYAIALALNGEPAEATRQLKVMRALHGEKRYEIIKQYWIDLSKDEFPQLGGQALP